jgi:hypothetical protein
LEEQEGNGEIRERGKKGIGKSRKWRSGDYNRQSNILLGFFVQWWTKNSPIFQPIPGATSGDGPVLQCKSPQARMVSQNLKGLSGEM